MARLTFYGGINEIGGNKILLEDSGFRLFLDFGFAYKRNNQFFEEYLQPRSGAGLLDPLAMGILPPIEGLYRADLAGTDTWQQFRNDPLYRPVDGVDGVLLTHAHLDHSGCISFLRGDIPIYSTPLTAFITKAIQDSGVSGLNQQICYYTPVVQQCPPGWRQTACLSARGAAKQQRKFFIADGADRCLSEEATQFWSSGFWEKTARQRAVDACALSTLADSELNVRCYPVDHSIPGACAWAIETGSGWIVYSGDLRLHGKHPELTRSFVEQATRLRPRALIIEGTNVARPHNVFEQEVRDNALKAISKSTELVIADFSPRDVDRLLTFLDIAKESGRKLAILAKDAYLLKTMHLLRPEVAEVSQDSDLVVYQKTSASSLLWQRNLFQEYDSKVVLAEDVRAQQDKFILCFSFFDLNELPSIRPAAGSLYVYSSSEPHDEEQEIDFRRLHNWLRHFEMHGFGLPVETSGSWQIPEEERGLHASGHACGGDLLSLVSEINPEVLIPIHSEDAGFYARNLGESQIEVMLPEPGGIIEV